MESPNSITGNAGTGVSVYQSGYGQIWANTINGNGSSGIHVEASAADRIEAGVS